MRYNHDTSDHVRTFISIQFRDFMRMCVSMEMCMFIVCSFCLCFRGQVHLHAAGAQLFCYHPHAHLWRPPGTPLATLVVQTIDIHQYLKYIYIPHGLIASGTCREDRYLHMFNGKILLGAFCMADVM